MSDYHKTKTLTDGDWSCTSIEKRSRNGMWVSRYWSITGQFPKTMRTLNRLKPTSGTQDYERWIWIKNKPVHFESREAFTKYMKDNNLSSVWHSLSF